MATFSSNSDEEKGIDMGDLGQELDQDEFDAPTTMNGGNFCVGRLSKSGKSNKKRIFLQLTVNWLHRLRSNGIMDDWIDTARSRDCERITFWAAI